MAEGGVYERIPTEVPEGKSNPGYDNNDVDENERRWQEQGATPKKSGGEETEMKRRGKYYATPQDLPGYIKKTSTTQKEGEQETSFGGRDLLREKQKEREELEKEILDVFPDIKKELIPRIFSDDYGRLIYKGDRIFKDGVDKNIPHIIAEGGRPSHDYSLKKFPQGLKRDLGRTNIEINQEVYRKQQEEERKLLEKERIRQDARTKLAENDDKMIDVINRKDNLRGVLKEQEEARDNALTPEDEESLTKSIETTKESYRTVSKEEDEIIVERDRLEKVARNADEILQEGEKQVETARERVDQRLLSLKDRIKEIFKKHGFTVVAVVSAIATVIGVIVSNLKAGLTKVAKGVGNGLKELGKKLGEILPGMIGAIASFLFRTAGEVIGFLAKNAWLLIVGLVVLAVEQFKKKG